MQKFTHEAVELIYARYFKSNLSALGLALHIGAGDGVGEYSTQFLESKLGWRTINIESQISSFELLLLNRPLSTNLSVSLNLKRDYDWSEMQPIQPNSIELEREVDKTLSIIRKNRSSSLTVNNGVDSLVIDSIDFVKNFGVHSIDLLVISDTCELSLLLCLFCQDINPSVVYLSKTLPASASLSLFIREQGYLIDREDYGNLVLINPKSLRIAKRNTNDVKTPKVNICTSMRDSDSHIETFFNQISSQIGTNFEIGSIIIGCTKETTSIRKIADNSVFSNVVLLEEYASDVSTTTLIQKTFQLATLGNQLLQASATLGADFTLILESDLCIPQDLITQLVSSCNGQNDIVAPVVFLGSIFYDSWGFRDLNGNKILSLNQINALPKIGSMTELSSVGSCLLVRQTIIESNCRMPTASYEKGMLVGFCLAARSIGAKVYCNLNCAIIHPYLAWRGQQWLLTRVYLMLNSDERLRMVNLSERPMLVPGRFPELARNSVEIVLRSLKVDPTGLYLSVAVDTVQRTIVVVVHNNTQVQQHLLNQKGFGESATLAG
jgi:hypothetical protein